jgi:TatD DNase family protein
LQSEAAIELIDTHCHLDLEPIVSQLPHVFEAALQAGVERFVVPGVHPDGWQGIAALAAGSDRILPAFGIHPMHAALATGETVSRLAELASRSIAVGEIGLDPSYTVSLEIQEQGFREQIRLAVSRGLPVLVHCRRAFELTLKVMREEKANHVGGIMHAFSGSPEMAREFIRLGFAISLSGTLTWDNAVRPVRLARELPLEHLVLETDAPDMTPQPYRGQPNQPAWLFEVLRVLAQQRGRPHEEIAAHTTENALSVLRIPGSVKT